MDDTFSDKLLKAIEEDERSEREFIEKLKNILMSMDARIRKLEQNHLHEPKL